MPFTVLCVYVFLSCLQNPQGWTLSFDCSTFPEDSWGLLLPQLRSLLQRWPTLSAAENARKLPHQTVVCSRKGEDHAVAALAAKLWPQAAHDAPGAAAAEADSSNSSSSAEAGLQETAGEAEEQLRGSLDGSLGAAADAPAAAAAAAAAVSVDRLVLELGWEVFQPKAGGDDEEEEEEEPPIVDFSLTLYNLQVGCRGLGVLCQLCKQSKCVPRSSTVLAVVLVAWAERCLSCRAWRLLPLQLISAQHRFCCCGPHSMRSLPPRA
jgi:hypothetical protein